MAGVLSRIPTIPMSYSERDQAVLKELLIDYNSGKIYVVSSYDKTVIYDLTTKISEYLQESGFTGDNLTINIEGIGEVELKDILSILYNNKENGAYAVQDADPVSIEDGGSPYQFDLKSIVVKNSKVQLYNFDTAPEGSIPQKSSGLLKWAAPTSTRAALTTLGMVNNVSKLTASNGVIQLANDNTVQNIIITDDGSYTVVTPFSPSVYYEIILNITVNSDVAPTLTFNDNIIFENDITIEPNTINIITLSTWNEGSAWLAKVNKYNIPEGYVINE